MSNQRNSGFAFVRPVECEALGKASARANKVFIYIRAKYPEGRDHYIGVRDFEEIGMGRTTAAKALKELVDIGLLNRTEDSSFGSKRRRAKYRIVNERQSADADNAGAYSPRTRKNAEDTVRENGRKPRLQSTSPDIPKEASRPSASKPKGREDDKLIDEPRVCESLQASLLRIESAAKALNMSDQQFINRSGDRKRADFLARNFLNGEIDRVKLADCLADPPSKGLADEWDVVVRPVVAPIERRVA